MLRSVPFALDGLQARNCFRDTASEAAVFWPTLSHLESTYPGFRAWYWGKVVPGLDNATRQILYVGSIRKPSAVAIVKRDGSESKICTLWVSETYRGNGIGRKLLQDAIECAGVDRPLFTVPHERYEEFRPLMARFGFEETTRIESIYRPGVIEHVYNGQLVPSLVS